MIPRGLIVRALIPGAVVLVLSVIVIIIGLILMVVGRKRKVAVI